ncbi:hypothetical protein [Microbulbifer elongatus]|uniref:hypothetical protein n=1 Tax=Microbulbifer elongatus TaxID=86173 RepID=UPI001E38F2FB|nr:hypothetical protein [Microbulbifer elongatus]
MMEDILGQQEYYLAGLNLLPRKEQPKSMRWLDAIGLESLKGVNPSTIISELQHASPVVVLDNYRIRSLPEKVVEWIDERYVHYCGSVYVANTRRDILDVHNAGSTSCEKKHFFKNVYSY